MSIKYYCSSAIKHRLKLPFKRLEKGGSIFCDVSQVYLDPSSNSQDVIAAGERAFLAKYGGKISDSLDLLRLVM